MVLRIVSKARIATSKSSSIDVATITLHYVKRDKGVGSSEKVDSYYNTVPLWHPLRYFFLVKGSSPWNRLVSVSYGMLHALNHRELVPRYRVVRKVAEEVVEKLRFGVQLDVLGPPRTGKSAGVMLGILRYVVEYSIPNYTVVVRRAGAMRFFDISVLGLLLGYLLRRRGSDVVVVSKTILLQLLRVLPQERIRVYGDASRSVIDCVEVIKDNSVDRIYLVYPHGRIAMGVEPPVTSVCSINFIHGVRRPATEYVKLRRLPGGSLFNSLKQVKHLVLRNELIPGAYIVVEHENDIVRLRLYTRWDYRYDIHCATQILGRWFLLDVGHCKHTCRLFWWVR